MSWKEYFRVFHWGPLFALFIISEITLSGLYCLLQWWPPISLAGQIHLAIYLSWDFFIVINFLNAIYVGPGHVPSDYKPPSRADARFLQYCRQCDALKAPRSHHCRKCGRCVLKMDHHCPWINNCVGHGNHMSFTLFTFFAPLGCIHAACVLAPSLYRALFRQYYIVHGVRNVPIVRLAPMYFFLALLGFSLAVGVAIAVGALFLIQFRSILRNRTGIESYICDKAKHRPRPTGSEFVYPYNLGWWRNFRMVCHFREREELDGTWWPVVDSCDQFTFTREQLAQKQEKADRSHVLLIVKDYSGSWFPITAGCKTCCQPPCTDEPRIPLRKGDRVKVTRGGKRWLYGDKILDPSKDQDTKRVRGWFPRQCAREPCDEDEQEPEVDQHSNGDHLPVSNGVLNPHDDSSAVISNKKTD